MALESVLAIAPPPVGAGNKDTQNSGEYQSDENVQDESLSTADPADLEEGEILDDSEGEIQENTYEKNVVQTVKFVALPPSGTNEEYDIDDEPGNIGRKKRKKKKKKKDDGEENDIEHNKQAKKKTKYVDHDRVHGDDMWFQGSPPNFRRSSMKDYHRSYDSPYDSPHGSSNVDYSPDRNRSESPNSMHSLDENANDFERGVRGRRSSRGRLTKRRVLGRKQLTDRGGFKKKKLLMRSVDLKKRRRPLRLKRREPRQRAVCKFYLEGKCLKGNDCPFAHNATPPKKKDLCKFFLNGYCAKGEKCLYMHGEFPCKFFHSGAQCYAEPNCKFSHEPMSEEMQKIFKKFLEKSKKEEEEMEMMFAEEANSPPRQKRPSLLGSPPRHVKEAAETWQWQQEMLQMQRNKRGMRNGPPQRLPFINSRPNFYMDTMSRSPAKQSMYNRGGNGFGGPAFDGYDGTPESPPRDCQTPIPTDEEDIDNFDQDVEEDNQFERASSWDDGRNVSHSAESPSREASPTHDANEFEAKSQDQPLSPPQSEPHSPPGSIRPSSPSAIPIHLPRRQRELFLRIQQHQKETVSRGEQSGDEIACDAEKEAEEELATKEGAGDDDEEWRDEEEVEEDDEEDEPGKEKWYSSDEDDTEDQPLAEVLKKLQQMPLPPRSQPSAVTPAPANISQPIDISKMLNNIRQQANQQVFTAQSEFWQNILSTAAPPVLPKTVEPVLKPQASRDPRHRDVKQPLLATPAEPPLSRDPRTNSRDPRSLGRVQCSTKAVEVKSTPIEDKVWEVRSHARMADGKANSVSYKIHTVSVIPRDYTPYLHATQNDLKLLGDPRLKKLIAQCPIPTSPLLSFPPNPEKMKEPEVSVPPLLEPRVIPEPRVRKGDPRLLRGSAKDLPIPTHLLNPSPVPCFPRPVIDPRLAKLHHPPDVQRMPQKRPVRPKPQVSEPESVDGTGKAVEKPLFKTPAAPKRDEAASSEKEAIGGSINRKSILDYASPLGSYDEGSGAGSGYSSYNRRPQQRVPPPSSALLADSASTPVTAAACAASATSTTSVAASLQGSFQCNIPTPLLPSEVSPVPQEPIPGFDPCMPVEDDASHASLKDVFKTIDPTASPFC